MRDIGWIFSDNSIRGILAGRKTQTRRLIKRSNSLVDGYPVSKLLWSWLDFASPEVFVDAGPSPAGNPGPYLHVPNRETDSRRRVYPRWHVGQRIYLKEWWAARGKHTDRYPHLEIAANQAHFEIWYRAQCLEHGRERFNTDFLGKWRPALFMPRALSRITLTITEVRAQRLRDISVSDARAEGISEYGHEFRDEAWFPGDDLYRNSTSPENYFRLWDSLNGKHAPADSNPWVWAYTFEHSTVTRHA